MQTICSTIEAKEEQRLAAFMERRKKELLKLCKTPFKAWRKGGYEKLKLELFRLEGSMQEASVGGAIEDLFVLSLIVEYCATRCGLLPPEVGHDQQECCDFVG